MTIKFKIFDRLFTVNSFYFYHLLKNKPQDLILDHDAVVWETCLRKIIFADDSQMIPGSQFMSESEALTFLISVLCGLQSKVIGETEIFGQFKKFVDSEQGKKVSFFQNSSFYQFILKEVKEIRDQYITRLGVNSYGSIIRKKINSDSAISVLGNGQLTEKIKPWLKNHTVQIHARNSLKYDPSLQIQELDQSILSSTVIIAAPISTQDLQIYLGQNLNVTKIIDCRSLDANCTSLKEFCQDQQIQLIELNDLFQSLEEEQTKIKQHLPVIFEEIKLRSEAYFLKLQHRPMGWDDLCG